MRPTYPTSSMSVPSRSRNTACFTFITDYSLRATYAAGATIAIPRNGCRSRRSPSPVVESRLLIKTGVSRTLRSRVIAGQQPGQPFLRQPACGRLRGDLVPEVEERLDVPGPKPFVFGHRQDDRDVPVLPLNHDRFPLSSVEDHAQPVLRL